MRSGFETLQLAQDAGERAKGMIENNIRGRHLQAVVAGEADQVDVCQARAVGKG